MKVLVIKTSALGDIIHAFPCALYIKNRYPHAEVDWVVERPFAELLEALPQVDRLFQIDTKVWRSSLVSKETPRAFMTFVRELRSVKYDVIFDLQGNMKSGLVASIARGRDKVGFDWSTVHEKPNVLFTNKRFAANMAANVRQENLSIVQSYFSDPSPFYETGVRLSITDKQRSFIQGLIKKGGSAQKVNVVVCPGSNWKNKQLSEKTWKKFLEKTYQTYGCRFMFTWGTQEERRFAEGLSRDLGKDAQILERMPLAVLQNLMGVVDLVIAMDSLPLHLAGTTSTPTFSIFGASAAKKYKPEGLFHGYLQGSCPYGRQFDRRCPILRTCTTGSCIRDLSGEAVFEAFRQWNNSVNLFRTPS